MFTKLILSVISLTLIFSLASCGTGAQSNSGPSDTSGNSQATPNATSDEDNYQMLPIITGKVADVKLDATANGSTQKLNKGEVVSITLESNPSTGYSWVANTSDTSVLVLMGEPEYIESSQSATPIVGAPGLQTFYFQATERGTAILTLDYMRPWEKDVAPEQTITITVEVQ